VAQDSILCYSSVFSGEHNETMQIQIYDTTLRDGSQREGISFTLQDKLRVARLLDDFGVAYIEGGWPGSNPKDAEFFERAKTMRFQHAKLASFGMTCRPHTHPAEDANCQAMVDAATPVITVVGKSWTLHVTEVLHTTLDENLRMIHDTVAYFKSLGREVIYDGEHFFDGYKADPVYALATLRAAAMGGADVLTFCDTNGGTMPWEIDEIIRAVRPHLPDKTLGIHCHNDSELAVANSLAAVRAGCTMVQGTINGYGERCGNANLCSIIADLELKMGKSCIPAGQLKNLVRLSHAIAETANLAPDDHLAYVGRSAFAHKGGIHVAAMRRHPASYQHIDPTLVGNEMRVVVSELSGRGNVLSKAEELGIASNVEQAASVLQQIKDLEARGFHFESADASVELMLRRARPDYQPLFELLDFMVVVEHREGRGLFAEGSVKLRIQNEIVHTVSEGNGPVNALDRALRKALHQYYPSIEAFHLADYKVRILDGAAGTAATTRVLIETANHIQRWNTVGASTNIIEASWLALYDAVEYGLTVAKTEP
jgi:2-isopropylmalate synthase